MNFPLIVFIFTCKDWLLLEYQACSFILKRPVFNCIHLSYLDLDGLNFEKVIGHVFGGFKNQIVTHKF
jgi:hypothetical protein